MALFSVADLSFVLPVTAVAMCWRRCSGDLLAEPVSPERWLGNGADLRGRGAGRVHAAQHDGQYDGQYDGRRGALEVKRFLK